MIEGDVIKCDKDTEHWYALSKESDVTYLAMYGGTTPTTWTGVLSQEYYDQVAAELKKNMSSTSLAYNSGPYRTWLDC